MALCRDVDGTCCLLDALTAPKASARRQQDVLSSLAFLTTGSAANSGSVVAAGGMAALVPLLGKRCERTVIGAVRVISNILTSPAGQVSMLCCCHCVSGLSDTGRQGGRQDSHLCL